MISFFNDAFIKNEVKLPIGDLAIQRGYGVFDFLKTINGKPVFLEEHLDRFYFSAQQLFLPVPYEKDELRTIILQLIEQNNIGTSGIRITLTGGNSEDGYSIAKPNLIITQKPIELITEFINQPYKLVTYNYQRQLPHVKSIDYLMAVWLQKFWKEKGADDVLYHNNGMITECPRSNIFFVLKDDTIITPSNNILKGVTRNKVLALSQTHFRAEERTINLSDLNQVKEAFITSTTKSILPVSHIDSIHFSDHSISKCLFDLLQHHTHNSI
jgi:D-alanine transaminase/branched-chain amino acid aminotransferase